jgi:hypothetical protein
MGILESFVPRRHNAETPREVPKVGDRVKYPLGTNEAAPVEFIGEEIGVFKLAADADNPNPGRRVAVYEAIKGSRRYAELSADSRFVLVRTLHEKPQAEIVVAKNDGEKSTVVVPLDQLKRAA